MMSPKEAEVMLKFMEMTISRVNQTQATLYATQQALIERGLVTEARLTELIGQTLKRPQVLVGSKALEAMVGKIGKNKQVIIPEGDNKATLTRIMNMIDNTNEGA
jgi:hypothetical protein